MTNPTSTKLESITLHNQTWGDIRVGDVLVNMNALPKNRRHKVTDVFPASAKGYLVIYIAKEGSSKPVGPTGGHREGGELTIERSV